MRKGEEGYDSQQTEKTRIDKCTCITYIATIRCDVRFTGVYLKAIDEAGLGFHILGSHVLFRGTKHHSTGRQTVHVAARAGITTIQDSVGLADAEHAVDSFAGGHVRLPILSGAFLGTGLELAVPRGISAGESVVAAIEYVHGACQLFFGAEGEFAVVIRISVEERSVLALLDVHGAGIGSKGTDMTKGWMISGPRRSRTDDDAEGR